jgi:hypothetical protein
MKSSDKTWWALIFILIIISLIALIFAILAWYDSQSCQPHNDLTRQDIKATCDLCVNGNTTLGGAVHIDNGMAVCGASRFRSVCLESLCYGQTQLITLAGNFQLSGKFSSYRVDTLGTNNITLLLPLVSQVPGHVFNIFVSQQASDNTVILDIADGDQFCSNTCTATNPVFTMPQTAGNADAVILFNDSVSSWFVFAPLSTI